MRWPFVRATLVLALLVCGVFGHGWHAQVAEPGSTVTSVAHHTASGVDSVMAGHSAAADRVSPSSADAAARDTHQPEHHACGAAWAADKSYSLAAPAPGKTASPADNAGRGELPVAAPASWSGRSLLLLQCVSRT